MNFWKDEASKKAMTITLVGGFILIVLVEPLVDVLWGVLFDSGNALIEYYVDAIYYRSALGYRDSLLVSVHFAIFYFGFIFGIAYFRKSLYQSRNYQLTSKTDEEVASRPGLSRWLLWIAFSLCVIGAVTSVLNLYTYRVEYKIALTFDQRFHIIAPLIDEQKEEELLGKWYLIKSRENFNSMMREMEDIAAAANMILPPPQIK